MEKSKYLFLFIVLIFLTALFLFRIHFLARLSVPASPLQDSTASIATTATPQSLPEQNTPEENKAADSSESAPEGSDKGKWDFRLKGSPILFGESRNTEAEDRERQRFHYRKKYDQLMEEGAYEEAVALVQKELDSYKEDPQSQEILFGLYYDLARVCMTMGDLDAVHRVYAEWIEVAPGDVNPKINLAGIYCHFGNKYDAAVQLLNQVEQEGPTPEEYDRLVLFYAAVDVVWEQERILRDWLEEWPDDERALSWWGLFNRHEGKNAAEALAAYERLAEISPEDPGILQNLGDMYLKEGYSLEARNIYERLLEQDPGNKQIQMALGDAFLEAGDSNRAQQYYESVLALYLEDGDSSGKILSLAERYKGMELPESALELYELVIEREAVDSPLAFVAQMGIDEVKSGE